MLVDLETTGPRAQNESWPVILTGQVHGFKFNNCKTKFININSVNYKTVKSYKNRGGVGGQFPRTVMFQS